MRHTVKTEKEPGKTRGAEYIVAFCKPGVVQPIYRQWVQHANFQSTYADCVAWLSDKPWFFSEDDRIELLELTSDSQLPPCIEGPVVITNTIHAKGTGAIHWIMIKLQFHEVEQEAMLENKRQNDLKNRAIFWASKVGDKDLCYFLADTELPDAVKTELLTRLPEFALVEGGLLKAVENIAMTEEQEDLAFSILWNNGSIPKQLSLINLLQHRERASKPFRALVEADDFDGHHPQIQEALKKLVRIHSRLEG